MLVILLISFSDPLRLNESVRFPESRWIPILAIGLTSCFCFPSRRRFSLPSFAILTTLKTFCRLYPHGTIFTVYLPAAKISLSAPSTERIRNRAWLGGSFRHVVCTICKAMQLQLDYHCSEVFDTLLDPSPSEYTAKIASE